MNYADKKGLTYFAKKTKAFVIAKMEEIKSDLLQADIENAEETEEIKRM